MAAEVLTKGQLVRYLQTSARWYFAEIRRVRGEDVDLRFFDDEADKTVGREEVESIEKFFEGRERSWSRTRSQLTVHFFDREFERLSEAKLKKMQVTLRKAGVLFAPDTWGAADTRIKFWLDTSIVARSDVDAELESLLPQWLEPFVLPTGSRDPLGLQASAEKLVNEVLPGLTVFTFRAGYYGFLMWAIRTVNGLASSELPNRTSRRDVLNALERALALCEFVHHGKDDDSCTLIGQRSKMRVLEGCKGDRCGVPESILKNQNSAGSFRLFSTSLVSLGLAQEADELIADGLLPFKVTPLGDSLASAFERRIDNSFLEFAMGRVSKSRDALRAWGKNLCFSNVAQSGRFRDPLLRGLLLGNSRDTEKRFRTASHLFNSGLISEATSDFVSQDSVSEADALNLEDQHGAGVSNFDVITHFYVQAPSEHLRPLQTLSVFEFLSLGLTAIFRAAVFCAATGGKVHCGGLAQSIINAEALSAVGDTPLSGAKVPTVRKLANDLVNCEDHIDAAALGAALLIRIVTDRLHTFVWEDLALTAPEIVSIIDRCVRRQMELSLNQILPDLMLALVERHQGVSVRKNRQRWLFAEAGSFFRDDPQSMGLGLHALRFPQFGSLVRDMNLRVEDVQYG